MPIKRFKFQRLIKVRKDNVKLRIEECNQEENICTWHEDVRKRHEQAKEKKKGRISQRCVIFLMEQEEQKEMRAKFWSSHEIASAPEPQSKTKQKISLIHPNFFGLCITCRLRLQYF